MRRALLLIAALTLATSCVISSRVGPTVLREDWSSPRRDPDPTRNPAAPEDVNPWGGEDQASRGGGTHATPTRVKRSRKRDLAERSAATFLGWMAAGWTPLIGVSGEFEEDPNARKAQQAIVPLVPDDQAPPPTDR